MANACIGCHGPRLPRAAGSPAALRTGHPAADLRPGRAVRCSRYADAEAFAALFKTGKRPDGSDVSPVMPFTSLKEMNEIDVRALYLYLRSLR